MDYKAIFKFCKELGCCDACCVRYCGLRKPTVFSDLKQFLNENIEREEGSAPARVQQDDLTDAVTPHADTDTDDAHTECTPTPAKRSKVCDTCVTCLGILQEDTWPECLAMAQDVLNKKKYETNVFSCALSAPLATIIREKAVLLQLINKFPLFDAESVTSVKEAWRWSWGERAARRLRLALQSGAAADARLALTCHMDYPDDQQESSPFEPTPEQVQRRQRAQRRNVPVTRALLDRALAGMSLAALLHSCKWEGGVPLPSRGVRCVSVEALHAPLYLGGRYVKLSRALPQSPWVVGGRRVMDSSVQEIIFRPLAELYGWDAAEAEGRVKFVSAGREDVDVRCLGAGRPFALEISDPRRMLSPEELSAACARIGESQRVRVHTLTYVTKEKLCELKQGEESKHKTYEALCVKLTHTERDLAEGMTASCPVVVHERDVARLNTWCTADTRILQRTPLRVLHRRTLLDRPRRLLALHATRLPDHPRLFLVRVQTEAGTYVKEWVHGEAGRTRPSLRDALGARCDILALDVATVHLAWP